MKNRNFLIPLLWIFIFCISCSESEEQKAKSAAGKFFASFSVPSPEKEKYWGMSKFKVFGRSLIAAGSVKAYKTSGTPVAFKVIIPFWVKGKGPKGESLTLSRQMHMTVISSEGKWQVQDYEFRNNHPLTLGQQVGTWVNWLLILSFLLAFLWSVQLTHLEATMSNIRIFILWLATLVLTAVISYICFGPWIGVLAGVGGYILICVVIYAVQALADTGGALKYIIMGCVLIGSTFMAGRRYFAKSASHFQSVRGTGSIHLIAVHYKPAENGSVKPNQPEGGDLKLFHKPLAEIAQPCLIQELKSSGFSMGGDQFKLEVDISRCHWETTFSRNEFSIEIMYRLMAGERTISRKLDTMRWLMSGFRVENAFREMIVETYETFFNEPEVKAFLADRDL